MENQANTIIIDEYYSEQKARNTLRTSPIGVILDEYYAENKIRIYEKINLNIKLKSYFYRIPLENSKNSIIPHWNNGMIGSIDAIMLYSIIVKENPRYYVECGSGNSTKFVAQAIKDHQLRTKIISIDPCPRSEIDNLCESLYRVPLEKLDLNLLSMLSSEDIFIFDGSHRAFTNSDVTVFMTEVLPSFPANMTYAIHDIFLPYDYPESWVSVEKRFYNEQYLLASYILGGAMNDSIEFPSYYLWNIPEIRNAYEKIIGQDSPLKDAWDRAGFFWMKKGECFRFTK